MSNAQDTIYITYVKATPAQVWAALTDGALTQKYFFGRRVESTWKPGAPWTLYTADGGKDVWGEVREADAPHRLVVTWEVNMPPGTPPLPQTIVSYDLEPIGEVVKLTMTEHHAGPIEDRFLEGGRQGWPRILSGLKSLLETGAALPLPIPQPPQEQTS